LRSRKKGKEYSEVEVQENDTNEKGQEDRNKYDSKEEGDMDVDELLGGGGKHESRRKMKRWTVETDDEEKDKEEEHNPIRDTPLYEVGSYMVATYDDGWYITLVEGEELSALFCPFLSIIGHFIHYQK